MTLVRRKPWTRPQPFVPKATGASAIDKGPTRNTAWLAHVRTLPCLCCPDGQQQHPTEAHHPKGLFPRTMGKRITDLVVLQICQWHHTISLDALHRGGDELGWWRKNGVEPYGQILSNLAGSRDPDRDEAVAFVKMIRERAAIGG